MPSLIFTKEDGNEIAYEFEGEGIGVGRHPDNEVPLDDLNASAHHARLTRVAGGYEITDSSSNGTKVNGERVERVRLRHGDRISFGATQAVYEEEGAPPSPPAPPPPPTMSRETMCRSHPDVPAEGRCAGCAEPFCPECLVEVHGEKYCGACKVMAVGGSPIHEEPTLPCQEANDALKYAIIGLFCFGIILEPIAISKAIKARRAIADDPRLQGEGKATAALVIGIVVFGLWVLGIISRIMSAV